MFSEDEKKLIIGLLVSFLLCAVFVQLASPQEYMITEFQLQTLETEFQSLKNNNSKLKELNATLQTQSTNRQNTIEQLTISCSRLESNLSELMQEAEKIKTEKYETQIKLEKQKKTSLFFFCASVIEFIILILCVIRLLRKRE